MALLLVLFTLFFLVDIKAQLSGRVGPTTPLSQKTNICHVYYNSSTSQEVGQYIQSAFNNCVRRTPGSVLYVHPGSYKMSQWVTLRGAVKWAFRMDGIITRTGTAGGHMFIIQGGNDFEMYSSTKEGAFQGAGVDFHKRGLHIYGPRILRLVSVSDFSLHDLTFVDSPAFHVILYEVKNGDVYNLIIRGHDQGGLDGINVSCENCHVWNVEVTNRDECVCVKSPSHNLLIENIFCNQAGGMSMGSYNLSTSVSNVHMRHIYSHWSTQLLMIKTYPNGNGYVKDCIFEDFVGTTSAYALLITQYWQNTPLNGDKSGVQISNMQFRNWNILSTDAKVRAPVYLKCSNPNPCTGITVTDVKSWDPSAKATQYLCQSAYGTGACLKAGVGKAYGATKSPLITTMPNGWKTPVAPSGALSKGFALNQPIPIPQNPYNTNKPRFAVDSENVEETDDTDSSSSTVIYGSYSTTSGWVIGLLAMASVIVVLVIVVVVVVMKRVYN